PGDLPPATSSSIVLGSITQEQDVARRVADFRFFLKADKYQRLAVGLLCAKTGREQLQHMPCAERQSYSIISSAVAIRVGGTARPSILADQALMTNSNLVDCTTGKSAGFAPLRMRPAYTPI